MKSPLALILLSLPVVLSCREPQPVCESKGDAEGTRWILECVSGEEGARIDFVGSFFDPDASEELPAGAHVYCSDRGPAFAWLPGVLATDPVGRFREKAVVHQIDDLEPARSTWMRSTGANRQPTYYLFGGRAMAFVLEAREGRELTLATVVNYDEEATYRVLPLVGLDEIVDFIPCFGE